MRVGELQEGVAAEDGDQVRQQDETVIVGLRQRLRWINVQREVIRKVINPKSPLMQSPVATLRTPIPRREIQRTPPSRSRRSWQLQTE